jgi:60S ribosome subunit biogenesis protein NIP7
MRVLSEEELTAVLEKLKRFLGENLSLLLSDSQVLRLQKERVFLLSEELAKQAAHFPRKALLCAGTMIGRFTHSKKFKLQVTALDAIASLAKHKVWLKAGGEQSFLYGNHVVKAHMKKITEEVVANSGVIVYSDAGEMPIGFGTMAKSVADCRALAGPESIVLYHQADCGEYLRDERELV